jgi:protein-L-isoaspartate(D-aspartate) O-methyltransferase
MDTRARRERLVAQLDRQGRIERDSTREALLAVPRHEFVPEARRSAAYDDRPLPIGEGQTISAPHMVAMMTDLLGLDPDDSVLEIGTGCGYHAAVTAEVVGGLRSVEYYEPLAVATRERLARLGYDVEVRVGDGHEGWPEGAPYDAAYLTCAAPEIPDPVVEQVRPGGRIVAPVGTRRQTLVRATKHEDGDLDVEKHGGVRFVRMQG